MDAQAPRLLCCMCHDEEVRPLQHVCSGCQAAVNLVDEQVPDLTRPDGRIAIGPTDV